MVQTEEERHFMVLHKRVALAEFNTEKKASKFMKKIIKEKAWISNHGLYYIVEVKQRYRVL